MKIFRLILSRNLKVLMFFCFIYAFLLAGLFNFKASAQQNLSNANANPTPSVTASPMVTPSPTPIPLSAIISEKEKTEKRVQEINNIFSEKLPVVRLQTEIAALIKDFDQREEEANNLITVNRSLQSLDDVETYWDSISLSLPSRKTRIQTQTVEISAQLSELQNIQAVWELTRKSLEGDSTIVPAIEANSGNQSDANNSTSGSEKSTASANLNANRNSSLNVNSSVETTNTSTSIVNNSPLQLPENLKEQVSELIEKIKQTQNTVRFKFGEIIKLQQKLADIEKRTNDMLNKIAAARAEILSNLVVKDAPPIWNRESFAPEYRQSVEGSFGEKFIALKKYLAENQALFLIHFLIMLALILAFRWARRKTRALIAEEPKLKNGLIIFEHPLASAIISGLFLGSLLFLNAPELLSLIASPFLVIAIFFLFRHLIERAYLPILVALVTLYVIDDLRLFVAPVPILTRMIFLLETFGGIAFLFWLIRYHQPPSGVQYAGTIRKISIFLAAPFVIALLANSLGYVTLAGVIGEVIVASLSIGLVMYALVKVVDSLLIFIFRVPPFSKLGMIVNHPSLVQKKIFQSIKWLAIVVWFIGSLSVAYLFEPFLRLLEKILEFKIAVGSVGTSVGSVIAFIFIIWFSFALSRFLRFALEQDIYPRVHLSSGLPYATTTIMHYLILLIGVFLALAVAGIDLTRFTIFLGALGVGVGIGLQNIVENFTSGLILLLERPVKIGDTVQMSKYQGKLKHIGLRSSIVKTGEGAEVIVPNGQLITEEVTNWTLSDPHRRIDINVGVEYGADPDQVIKLLEEVGLNHPDALAENPARALFLGFGENSLDFQLRIWTSNQDNLIYIKSDLITGVYRTLKDADIEIPFPQRDLHIQSINDEILEKINPASGKTTSKKEAS